MPVLTLLAASHAGAQGGVDTVRLESGGLVRGRIVEYVPDAFCRIELADGEIRRIEAADIASVEEGDGASTDVSGAPPPSEPPRLAIEIRSEQPDLEVHRRTGFAGGTPRYESLCRAPCTVELPPGDIDFAVSQGARDPIPTQSAFRLTGPSALSASYANRSDLRTAGWILTFVGGAAGVVVGGVGFGVNFGFGLRGENYAIGFAGFGTAAVSIVVGIILIVQHDEAALTQLAAGEAGVVRF